MSNQDNNLQPELKSKLKETVNSYLKSYRISPTSGNPSKFLTSSQTTVFEIPSCVFNPSKMSLNFKRGQIAAYTDGYYCIVAHYINFIERLELRSADGTIIVDCPNVGQYSRLTMPLLNNFRENTQNNLAMYPSRSIANDMGSSKNNEYDTYLDNFNTVKTDTNAGCIARYANYEWSLDNTAMPPRSYNLTLNDLLGDSFFSCNRELYTAKTLYLRIQWAPYTSWLYKLKSVGAAFDPVGVLDIDFTNLNLHMYIEANPLVEQVIKEKFNSQQVLICPQIQTNSITVSNAAGDRSVIVKVLNPGNARLYKVYSGIVSGNSAGFYTINNTSNYNNLKYTNVEMYLDSQQIVNLNTEYNQDLEHILQMFKNHSFTDLQSFKAVSPFAHVFDCSQVNDKLNDGNTLVGIPFDNNGSQEHSIHIRYKITAPSAGNINPDTQTSFTIYVFCILMTPIYIKGGSFQTIPFI